MIRFDNEKEIKTCMKLRVERCYGTRLFDGDKQVEGPDNFIAFYDNKPIIVVMYKSKSGGGHGGGSFECKEYNFIDLTSMTTIKDVMEIEVDRYELGVKRGD